MKRFYLFYIVIASLFLQSCDKIDEPFTIPVPAKAWYGKRILLEDYTGQRCPNCPGAAIIANDIKSLYGDQVVIISVHAGFFAEPKPVLNFPADYRSDAGNEWDGFFGISNAGNPNGMINRVGFPTTTQIVNPNAWASKVGSMMTEIPEMDITISTSYSNTDRKLSGTIKTKFLKTIKKNLKLQLLITEDSIISPQQNTTSVIPDYVHRHMLRGAINGSWGSVLTDGQTNTPIDTELSQNLQYTLDAIWKSRHCSIVAFVYDADTYEILQVAEKHVEE